MKCILKVLCSIILLVIGSLSILILLENNSISEVQIDFELPLPSDIAARYRISEYPNIERIILTDFFSDWDEEDLNYKMTPVSSDPKNHRWTIDTILPPGEHQYKFAIYVKDRTGHVWSHYLDSYKQVYNGMDRFNSLISVGSYINIKKILQLTIYILMGVFIPLLLIYIIKRTTFKNTLVILFIILIVTNSIFTIIQREYNSQYYSFLSKSIINIIQNDYERDDSDIYMTFNLFLWYKLDKMGIKNLHSRYRYTSLLFFNEYLELRSLITEHMKIVISSIHKPYVPVFQRTGRTTNKEIADDLNISKLTVDNHVYNILHKTAVKNRVEPLV